MKVAVLGAGFQGTACAYDMCQNPAITEVLVADNELTRAEACLKQIGSPKAKAVALDVTDPTALIEFLKPCVAVVSAVPYFLNAAVTEAAIASGTHMVDMGGNTDLVLEQRKLNAQAKAAGVTILPDCGLAPGMANILAAHLINQFDEVDSVHIRVGGLPQQPQPPLNYRLFFSIHGLINEYVGKAVVLRNGKIETVDTLTEVEEIDFPEPVGPCEAFHTLGGLSTLPWTYEGKVRNMDYKTVRYPGHCAQIAAMNHLGLFEQTPVVVDGQSVVPRNVFAALATPRLLNDDPKDYVVVKVWATGQSQGQWQQKSLSILDAYDPATGFTAMMRTTAFPVAIVAQMMADGTIDERGVLALETAVPTNTFMRELTRRNISVGETISPVERAPQPV